MQRDVTRRQGHAGAANTRRVLCVSPRDGRLAARAGVEEDGARCGGEEDHGCWRARFGRYHGGYNPGPAREQQAVQERVRTARGLDFLLPAGTAVDA